MAKLGAPQHWMYSQMYTRLDQYTHIRGAIPSQAEGGTSTRPRLLQK